MSTRNIHHIQGSRVENFTEVEIMAQQKSQGGTFLETPTNVLVVVY